MRQGSAWVRIAGRWQRVTALAIEEQDPFYTGDTHWYLVYRDEKGNRKLALIARILFGTLINLGNVLIQKERPV